MNMDIDDLAVRASEDEAVFERLVNEYKPFICSQVKKHTGQPYVCEQDDTYSIGLFAFYKAVKTYENNKGGFIVYASSVIKNHLIDSLRKDSREVDVVSLDLENDRDGSDSEESVNLYRSAIDEYNSMEERTAIKDEIASLSAELEKYGVSFSEMEQDSPKHHKVRDEIWHVIDAVSKNEEICRTIIEKRYLPVKKICIATEITPKKIEKFRNYILACIVISLGDYPILHDYLQIKEGE